MTPNRLLTFTRVALLLCLAASLPASATQPGTEAATDNAALVAEAFENWKQGRGSVFDLLADDAHWTVAGESPVSGTYSSKQELVERAVRPIHARLSTPITPEVWQVVAQGEHVVVLWDGTATTLDGGRYANQYAWHLQLEDGRITRVTAFLDTWTLQRLMGD